MITLPLEIIKHIFGDLSSKQRSEICTVCKLWETILVGFVSVSPYENYHAFVRSKQPVDLVAACAYSDLDLIARSLATPGDKHKQIYIATVGAFKHGAITTIEYMLKVADDTLPKESFTNGRLNHYSLNMCVYEAVNTALKHDQIHVIDYLEMNKYSDVIGKIYPGVDQGRYYSNACTKCKVSTLEYLENKNAVNITGEVLAIGLDNACGRNNMNVIKYLVPRVHDLTSAYHSACGDENIDVINYLNQFSARIRYDECYKWCEGHYFDSNMAEAIIKYAVRPVSQHVIRRSFVRACEIGDYAAMTIIDWLAPMEHEDAANTIIIDGFYSLCANGTHDMTELCVKYNFTIEQLRHGLSLMPVVGAQRHPQHNEQITRARSSLEVLINNQV